jgi:hypothetical protein
MMGPRPEGDYKEHSTTKVVLNVAIFWDIVWEKFLYSLMSPVSVQL